MRKRVVIMGAAGRDFHNFNMRFKGDPAFDVVAFTAAQIPFIERRSYPQELSGALYPKGIPIRPESELADMIKKEKIDSVVFSYSDVSNDEMMERASIAVALGADFVLLGAESTMLRSRRPVVSVCAVRTGCGKSGVTRFIASGIMAAGKKAAAVRHPMPYGDLVSQRAQRFSSMEDISRHKCTIEEREEYEPLVEAGITVYAGVDYAEILRLAEQEADVIVWDGGNNDLPFIRPDLEITVADPFRPGHAGRYFHGQASLRRAAVVVINKADSAPAADIASTVREARKLNPGARIIKTASRLSVDGDIRGKRVLVIEDGPTLTHGGMDFGAGVAAARANGATAVDARAHAVGSIRDTLLGYPALQNLVPAMGYSLEQIKDLEETINRTPCDAVLIATPVDLASIIRIERPAVRVRYKVEDMDTPGLKDIVAGFIGGLE